MKKLTLFIAAISYQLLAISFNAQAQYRNLINFDSTNGANSWGTLIISGHVLYGTTGTGGANNFGEIFSVHSDGTGFKDLWDFDDTGSVGNANGIYPGVSLTLSGNILYGTTLQGGGNYFGNIFSIDTDGTGYKDLWDFDDTGSNGNTVQCTLVISGKKLYGMTEDGGPNTWGDIFSINTNGSGFKDLWDFYQGGDTNGAEPYGSLILSGKKLYGMTEDGGTNDLGNVFSIDTDGSHYKDLFDFTSHTGYNPNSSLILSGKVLYGMTPAGGRNSDGVVFSVDTDGNHYKNLLTFDSANGANPDGSLIISGNLLCGMTNAGGSTNNGVIFAMDTNGQGPTVIFNFDTAYGINPEQALLLSGGTLYGMAPEGGTYGDGVLFSDDICNLLTSTQHVAATDSGNCWGSATVSPSGGPSPFTYSWSNGQTKATATGLCAGTYTCTITDYNGCSATTPVTVNYVINGISQLQSESEEVKVYPNPSNGQFTIQLAVGSGQSSVMEVYNVLGEQVLTETLQPQTSRNEFGTGSKGALSEINLSSQPNGIYLYRVITNNGELIGEGKIIVQK